MSAGRTSGPACPTKPKTLDEFQRLHKAEDFEGNGIGPATVRRILQLHRGKICFEAELDKEATFHFTLPDATAPGR